MGRSTPSSGSSQWRNRPLSEHRTSEGTRRRLTHISHHFLSGKGDDAGSYVLTLACLAPDSVLPCALARALCRQSIPAVYLREEDGQEAWFGRPPAADEKQKTLALTVRSGDCLARLEPGARLLILGPADDAGLETAFLLCKRLLGQGRPALLGYVPTDCRHGERAAEAYYRLATAIHRFLGAMLVSFGYMPPWDSSSASLWTDRLHKLAALISEDWLRQPRLTAHHDTGRR